MDTLLSDELWDAIAPYLPEPSAAPQRGRRRLPDRDCLRGILFVLREGLRWQSLPKSMGCGSGSTCWRRFREWTALGLWQRAHWHLVAALGERGLLHLERAIVDSSSCRALEGGDHTGPNPDRRGQGRLQKAFGHRRLRHSAGRRRRAGQPPRRDGGAGTAVAVVGGAGLSERRSPPRRRLPGGPGLRLSMDDRLG